MTDAFWKGRRVLVTGHTGFKGSWLSLWLQQMGAEVSGLALDPPTKPSLFDLARVGTGMVDSRGDIRDLATVRSTVRSQRPEIIIHMAAQPLVRAGYEDPVGTYATNVMGSVHVLEAARLEGGVKAIVNVTTDKCYENKEWVWSYRENDRMGGHDPYSNSKACSELVTSAYTNSFFGPQSGVALASARAGNVIGGGDWAQDRLVPDLLRSFERGEPTLIRNPHATRPWQHVLEPLAGYITLARRLYDEPEKFRGGWNFGPEDQDARPVGWIADRLASIWGDRATWSHDGSEHPHEANNLRLDSSKSRMLLGWQPQWNLGQALDTVVDWQRAYLTGANAKAVTLKQIDGYRRLLTAAQ